MEYPNTLKDGQTATPMVKFCQTIIVFEISYHATQLTIPPLKGHKSDKNKQLTT